VTPIGHKTGEPSTHPLPFISWIGANCIPIKRYTGLRYPNNKLRIGTDSITRLISYEIFFIRFTL